MKALILNSGLGKRMGTLTADRPKCLTRVGEKDTILSRQLKLLAGEGIREAVITTGPFEGMIERECGGLDLPISVVTVKNPCYERTNYIYSIYCARELLGDEEILLLHGDLVFEPEVLSRLLTHPGSCMAVSSSRPLPEKDFKAVVEDGFVRKVGVEYFENAVAAQALYKLEREDWNRWLDGICRFCREGRTDCYAEKAFNEVSGECRVRALDIRNLLCGEIDDEKDLAVMSAGLEELENRTVYLSFSADVLHSGHISLIRKAAELGRLTVGVLSDEAVASYRRYPLIPFEERKSLFEAISGVTRVVEQRTLSYRENLERLKPDIVVHGDDWRDGFQKPIRDEVVSLLASYGGRLVEFPYSRKEKYRELEDRMKAELATPELRRGRLRKLLGGKGLVTAIEAHSGITGLIAEKTVVWENGCARQFDAMWISSLCDSTAKGKPDIELVDMTSRYRTIDDIMEVTTKPLIFDGDTGGLAEHFIYTVRTLERMGVSAVIIEDKTGLKKNSLFGTEAEQTQDTIEDFCAKIAAGKRACRTKEFMIIARIESLILEQGMEDALKRARAYRDAGADGIMIHSRKKEPSEIFAFMDRFRAEDAATPVVVVPTSFNGVTEEEFREKGVNVVIYANQLTRSGFPAMKRAAELILQNHRAMEADKVCMPIREIITLIPEES